MENILVMAHETADVVIIGGGVLGASVAYYLAKQAVGQIIVLERNTTGQANTSLAAGLLTRARFKPSLIPMVLETYRAIEEIESLIGEPLGLHRTGGMYAAISPERKKELNELVHTSLEAGLGIEWLDNRNAKRLVPWLELADDAAILLMSEDGFIDGYRLARGYMKAAQRLGVEVREQTPVLSISRAGDKVVGVKTDRGGIGASTVIDAAGVWAGLLAYQIGVNLPMAPVRSHYWITAQHPKFSPEQPFVILPDAKAFARPEVHQLLFGLREPQSVSVDPRILPREMGGYVFEQDLDGRKCLLEGVPGLARLFPLVQEIGISKYIAGLSNYTPDGMFVLGKFPGLNGFHAATGCSGAGIAMSGGIGRSIAELVAGDSPSFDLEPHRIDRFGGFDPLDPEFMKLCGQARSGKITG